MNNIEKVEEISQEILDVQSLTDLDVEMLDRVIEKAGENINICTGILIVRVLTTVHKVGKSLYDYIMCRRLLKFYAGCKDVDFEKKEKFYRKNIFGKKREIGYLFLQLLERLDEDEKAFLIGKLYVYCAENEYDLRSYFRICKIVEKCYYENLHFLSEWESKETICAKNKFIPQEVMESMHNDGLISACGNDGGGFGSEDDEGVIYKLSKYGETLLNII